MILDLSAVPTVWLVLLFLFLGFLIVGTGIPLVRRAELIAQHTGIGEALTGGLLLGSTTSLPGVVLSVISANFGHTELAISNAVGGIAAQTAFLGLADIAYRRANLEHAAASFTNLNQVALLIALLTIPLIAMTLPPLSIFGISFATPILFAGYILGIILTANAKKDPMWQPINTRHTQKNQKETASHWRGWHTWISFGILAGTAAAAGFLLAETSVELAEKTGLDETAVGVVFTAVTTSLPELVTAIAAVKRGALTLAVGGIVGGNAFDVLLLAFSDIAYRDGSIYHSISQSNVFIITITITMTAILLLGLLRRERHGIAGIGFESALILALYSGTVLFVFL